MRIQGKLNADIVGYSIRRNKSHDGRTALLDVDVGVDEGDAEKKLGEDFHTLAFATMRVIEAEDDDDVDTVAFLVDVVKPGRRVVLEKHVIDFEGDRIEEQPRLLAIRTLEGKRSVVVRLRIPIDADRGDQIGFGKKVGKTLKVEFNPKQAGFQFKKGAGANGNGDHPPDQTGIREQLAETAGLGNEPGGKKRGRKKTDGAEAH